MNYNRFLTLGTDQQLIREAKKLQARIMAYIATTNEKQAYTWIVNELKINRSINI